MIEQALPTPDELAVLAALLRARPASRGELPAVVHRPAAELAPVVEALAARGFLSLEGDAIRYPDPEAVLARIAGDVLARQQAELDAARELWALLPSVVADARTGAVGAAPRPPAEVVHGPEGQWQLWMRLMSEAPPRYPVSFFPELPRLAAVVMAGEDELRAHQSRIGFETRAVVSSASLADPETREAIRGMQALGAEVRSLPRVPSWFYADTGVLVALPLRWGEVAPTSLLVVKDAALVAVVAAYAELLWGLARPLPARGVGWEPVLELMAQGLSDDDIAAALDLSPRTVRRRVAEASEEWGVHGRFALGAAWASRR